MKKASVKVNKLIAVIITLVILTGIVTGGVIYIRAGIGDNAEYAYISDDDVEDSTLIIGTHLIYLGSMTDELYKTAMASQNDVSMFNIYYKSELAGGVWFDITDASSIADIISEGVPVSKDVIENLSLTHHTKSDGITYDLVKKSSVCLFDIQSPYELDGLSELQPIKLQADTISGRDRDSLSDTDTRNLLLVRELYDVKPESSETKKCDESIKALQSYYEILVRDEGDREMSAMVQKVQGKLDSERRYYVMSLLQEIYLENLLKSVNRNKVYEKGDIDPLKDANAELPLSELLESVINGVKGSTTEDADAEEDGGKGKKIDNFAIDSELISAISNAISNCENSYNEALQNRITEGSNVLSAAEYECITALCEKAEQGDYAACDVQTKKLIYIDRVLNSQIKENQEELGFITGELSPKAVQSYLSSLALGAGPEYSKLPATAAAATRNSVLKKRKNEAEGVRNELQFLITACVERMATGEAEEYIKSLISSSEKFYKGLKQDQFYEFGLSSVDSYKEWLTEKLTSLCAAEGTSEMNKLSQEKKELQEKRLEALDSNDLKTASKLMAEIEAVDLAMADLEKSLGNIAVSSTATEAEKASALAALGSGNATASILSQKDSAIESIRNGETGPVSAMIEAIGALAAVNSDAALASLKEVYKEIAKAILTETADISALNELSQKVEEVTADNMSYFMNKVSEEQITGALNDLIAAKGLKDKKNEAKAGGAYSLPAENASKKPSGTSKDDGRGGNTDSSSSKSGDGTGTGIGESTGEDSGSSSSKSGDGTGSDGESGSSSSGDSSGSGTESGSSPSGDGSGTGRDSGSSSSPSGDGTGTGTSQGGTSSQGEGSDSGTGSASSESKGILSAELKNVLDELNDSDLAGVLAGMSMYSERTGSKETQKIVEAYSNKAVSEGNAYLFETLKSDPVNDYIAADTLARVIGYRYIFNDSQMSVTLQKGANYYIFTAFSNVVGRPFEVTEEMTLAASYNKVVYIDPDYVRNTFSIDVRKLTGSKYSAALSEDACELAQDFYNSLLELSQ